jgi:hypothetical protein
VRSEAANTAASAAAGLLAPVRCFFFVRLVHDGGAWPWVQEGPQGPGARGQGPGQLMLVSVSVSRSFVFMSWLFSS